MKDRLFNLLFEKAIYAILGLMIVNLNSVKAQTNCGITDMTSFSGLSANTTTAPVSQTIQMAGYSSGDNVTLTLTNGRGNGFLNVTTPTTFSARNTALGGDTYGINISGLIRSGETKTATLTYTKPIYNVRFKVADIDFGSGASTELLTINLYSGSTLYQITNTSITEYQFSTPAGSTISNVFYTPQGLSISGNTLNGTSTFAHQIYVFELLSTNSCPIPVDKIEFIATGGSTSADTNMAIDIFDIEYCANNINDSDADVVINACDLDSDNDGILDTDEGRCLSTITNGDFELPNLNCNPPSSSIIPSTSFPGWDSLGTDGTGRSCGTANTTPGNIEIWRSGFNSFSAFTGNQFVELNAYDNGALLQNINLPSAGSYVITWGLAHRGRAGVDVMRVTAKQGTTTLQTQDISDDRTAWRYINGSFNVTAATASTISFSFEAVSSSGGNISLGNFIDSVSVCVSRDTDSDTIPDYLDLDSDNDGCPDAGEGGNTTIPKTSLVASGGTLQGGNGVNPTVSGLSGYNQSVLLNLGTTVGSTSTTLGIPTIAGTGQTIRNSTNSLINSCFCYDPASVLGTPEGAKHGISLLKRAGADNGNWPMNRNSAHTVLESNIKGFVITRMTSDPAQTTATNYLSNDSNSKITNPVEGMMVYDTFAKCLKIYDGAQWNCFITPTCP